MRPAPRYPANTGPQSRSPIKETVIGSPDVSISAITTRVRAARNFPATIWHIRTGRVSRISMVPIFCSSLHRRMVNAATRKIRRIGSHRNRGRISAILRAKKVSIQKKTKRERQRNVPVKIEASGDAKYASSSLRAIAHICFIRRHHLRSVR